MRRRQPYATSLANPPWNPSALTWRSLHTSSRPDTADSMILRGGVGHPHRHRWIHRHRGSRNQRRRFGSRFGLSLAWMVVVGVIGICLFAQMAGRVAAVSGRATFDLVRERLGARVALVNLA